MIYSNTRFDEERALYGLTGIIVDHCRFEGPADGESALKETSDIHVRDCFFDLRYPFWHVKDGFIERIEMTENCRAALWYDENMRISDSRINGIKAVRECQHVSLKNCTIQSPEFAWKTEDVSMQNCSLISEYPFFEGKQLDIHHLSMKGKYSFQYIEQSEIYDSELKTKDAFWHSSHVTVYDSIIEGEYLGWYSDYLKLVRCTIRGTQPLCYCHHLVLEDCIMENCDLAFEKSDVEATVISHIDSIKNPISGHITASSIGDSIIEYETSCQITASNA